MNLRRNILVIVLMAVIIMITAAMALAQANTTAPNIEAEKRVSLQFKDVPIGNAIAVLFEGINHVVEPGVQGTVTLVLNDVPFTDALQALLKASGLTARKESGVYYVGPRKELPTDAAAQASVVPDSEVQVQRSKIPEKISIGYADVQEIGSYLGAQIGASQRNSSGMGGGMMGGMGGGIMGGMGMGGGMMGGGMGGMGGGMGGMGGGMGGYGGGMGGMGGGMGGYGGGMGGGGMARW
jgi:hypothetical protein